MRRIGVFALVLFGAELCSVARSGGPGCGTTRESGREAIFLHRQSARARRARTAALAGPVATAAGDRDIGNIAIIEDSGGVVEKLNQFNLDGASIAFSPTASNAATYRYAAGGPAWDAQAAAQGSPLIALGDDDAR